MSVTCLPEQEVAPAGLNLVTCIISALISVFATFGNCLIIIIVIKDPLKKLHTPFNYFLVNLAASDLIVGVVTMPLSFYVHYVETTTGGLSNVWSEVLTMSYFISAHSSLLSLLALSVDRYIAIVKAIKYRMYLSWSRSIKVSFGIWFFSLTLPCVYFKVGYTAYLMYYGNTVIMIGFIIMTGIFVKIQKFFHNHRQMLTYHNSIPRAESVRETEKKVTDVFSVIIMVFIVTYISAAIMNYVVHFCQSCACEDLHVLREVQFLLVTVNCCINPYICIVQLSQYKLSARKLLEIICVRFRHDNKRTIDSIDHDLMEPLLIGEGKVDEI